MKMVLLVSLETIMTKVISLRSKWFLWENAKFDFFVWNCCRNTKTIVFPELNVSLFLAYYPT